MNEHYFFYNNEYFLSSEPVIHVGNRGFRFGDGLFETMRMYEGRILNADFHFERLFHGMKMLQFDIPEYFSKGYFVNAVNEVLLKNSIFQNARIRMMVFRGDGNVYDTENNDANIIIETFELNDTIELNENGLVADIFTGAKKSCDLFANLKSNNALASVMARLFAKQNNLDDTIILNCYNRVCESSIANVFIIKDEKIFTPPLSEGCIAGTLRRWMLGNFSSKKYVVSEKNLSVDDLFQADELFLTNSIQPIRWVKNIGEKIYDNRITKEIFKEVELFIKKG
jgi:branched-chain amino acid aminotransferase